MAYFKTHFFADSLGLCTRAEVLMPDRPDPSRPIPVLYLLHGQSDDETIWMRRTAIERYISPYYLAVVMPFADRSYYSMTASGSDYFKYVSEELPRLMESYFPFSRCPSGRFIAGLSMGGYGALKTGLANSGNYAAIAALSAVCDVSWCRQVNPTLFDSNFKGTDPNLTPTNIFLAANELAKAPEESRPAIFQYCGRDDFLWNENLRFRDHLRSLKIRAEWREGPGGHSWENWDEQIRDVLKWLPISENSDKTGAIGI